MDHLHNPHMIGASLRVAVSLGPALFSPSQRSIPHDAAHSIYCSSGASCV